MKYTKIHNKTTTYNNEVPVVSVIQFDDPIIEVDEYSKQSQFDSQQKIDKNFKSKLHYVL